MKQKIIQFLLCIAMVLFITGCTANNSENHSETESESQSSETESSESENSESESSKSKLQEVRLTLDNFEDYFEILDSYHIVLDENGNFDGDIFNGVWLGYTLMLREEYEDKIVIDGTHPLDVSFECLYDMEYKFITINPETYEFTIKEAPAFEQYNETDKYHYGIFADYRTTTGYSELERDLIEAYPHGIKADVLRSASYEDGAKAKGLVTNLRITSIRGTLYFQE